MRRRRMMMVLLVWALLLVGASASAQSVPTAGGGVVDAGNLNTAAMQPDSGLVLPNSPEVKRAQGSDATPTPVKSTDEATVPFESITVTP